VLEKQAVADGPISLTSTVGSDLGRTALTRGKLPRCP
jgi:hypothetical protein